MVVSIDGAASGGFVEAVLSSALDLCIQKSRQWCLEGMLDDPHFGLRHVIHMGFSESPIDESRSSDSSPHDVLR